MILLLYWHLIFIVLVIFFINKLCGNQLYLGMRVNIVFLSVICHRWNNALLKNQWIAESMLLFIIVIIQKIIWFKFHTWLLRYVLVVRDWSIYFEVRFVIGLKPTTINTLLILSRWMIIFHFKNYWTRGCLGFDI